VLRKPRFRRQAAAEEIEEEVAPVEVAAAVEVAGEAEAEAPALRRPCPLAWRANPRPQKRRPPSRPPKPPPPP
tara:strand:+ start:3607 stop:3825 length:219 start_codon:yes stop_codon:yes gene_type:complete